MKRNTMHIFSIATTTTLILLSVNPVIGVSLVYNEIEEEVHYVTIHSSSYFLLKDILNMMYPDSNINEDLDLYSFEVEEEKTVYIPIVCELVKAIAFVNTYIWVSIVIYCYLESLDGNSESYPLLDIIFNICFPLHWRFDRLIDSFC